MKYVFYFDEAFHDRKIVIASNGTINTLRDDTIDDYIGVFWGCERARLSEYMGQLTKFEEKYKKVFTLEDGQELKSEIIGKKNYQYGIRTFNKNAIALYSELFELLSNWNYVLQINVISKVELLIRCALQSVTFPIWANKNAFIYSLTKLIIVHKPRQLLEAIKAVANGGEGVLFRDTLLETLKALTEASKDVPRKKHSVSAFQEMRYIIESITFAADFNPKTDFIYKINFDGLCNLLNELHIKEKDIKITIDKEENTFKAAENYKFGKVKQGQSNASIQLRLSDLLGGFIGRMIYAMKHDEATKEKDLTDYRDIDLEDIKKKRLLSPKWFELKEDHYNMYKLIYNAMIVQHEHYWTTSYNDDTICFYSLIRHVASYPSYEQFSVVSPELHAEYFNSRAVAELSDYYAKL